MKKLKRLYAKESEESNIVKKFRSFPSQGQTSWTRGKAGSKQEWSSSRKSLSCTKAQQACNTAWSFTSRKSSIQMMQFARSKTRVASRDSFEMTLVSIFATSKLKVVSEGMNPFIEKSHYSLAVITDLYINAIHD